MTISTPADLRISTPGRICLFGEHQDYLRLPVIACAISLRITLAARRRSDDTIHILLPDIGSEVRFTLSEPIRFEHERDYFRSGVQVLREAGFEFHHGLDCTVNGNIPINAGTSSSTALVTSWINLLARMSVQQKTLSARETAYYAHRAEVVVFNEPGGSMDHFATALGGVHHIAFWPAFSIELLPCRLQTFVLGDSDQPKDTRQILADVKNRILDVVKRLQAGNRSFSLATAGASDSITHATTLTAEERGLLDGTLRNRDITSEALSLLRSEAVDGARLGRLLLEHQRILRDVLGISTPKIDRMIDAACSAGALGGKINGSGGGGCMFVYAPDRPEEIAEAIATEGGHPYIVTIDEGTRLDR